MMADLAKHWDRDSISTRVLSNDTDVPYQLACKLMQRLQKVKLVKSTRGPRGGFSLSKSPSVIYLLEIIEAIQGPVTFNRCLVDVSTCIRQSDCPVSGKLVELQEYIINFLRDISLSDLLKDRRTSK
ncbi:MAG: RrF2 family transcriptional regulator, partial [Planctomycetota bacterium]|jgi:Rrf2 family protein